MGYDAGYYGYAWADSISADMATVFENAPERYFDSTAGQRLRREIYEVGDSRPRARKPFLLDLGILDDERLAKRLSRRLRLGR